MDWERPHRWWNRRVLWSELRSIGNSRIVQASILMPVIGYLLLFNDEIVKLSGLIFNGDADPPLTRLYFTYYGLTLLAVGSVIYAWFCPMVVKKYPAPVEYFLAEGTFFSDHDHYLYLLNAVILGLQRDGKYMLDDGEEGYIREYVLQQFHPDNMNLPQVMNSRYKLIDASRRNWRYACAFFLFSGLLVLAVPTIWTLLEVSRLI